MRDTLLTSGILLLFVLVGILVSFCGIGLSLGLRKLSVICFFAALGVLVLLRIIGWKKIHKKGDRKPR